jgi:glycosyltransferase involved in cell wall biosynthesis
MGDPPSNLGVVAIGRNEGSRLAACLASLPSLQKAVYVDSGSTDGSVDMALRRGMMVVELTLPPKFTAARARNAGLQHLLTIHEDLEFVQMVDGDCEILPQWLDAALAAMRRETDLAVVFGRLRERYPMNSIYNELCDDEWNVPIGEAYSCGGIALFRIQALREANYYDASMIAGEEPDLCVRLRHRGWRIRRIAADMALHDANITRFAQWWSRTRRSGHAYAELAHRYPNLRDPDWRHQIRSIVAWGGVFPVLMVGMSILAIFSHPGWWVGVLSVPMLGLVRAGQLTGRKLASGLRPRIAVAAGISLMLGKLPQFAGIVTYWKNRITGRSSQLIEYKSPT